VDYYLLDKKYNFNGLTFSDLSIFFIKMKTDYDGITDMVILYSDPKNNNAFL
jgi:hypothetical protein